MSRRVIACETIALIGLLVATAGAQPVTTSFDQLQFVVKTGQKITVRDFHGDRISGKILSVSPTSIALLVKGQRRDLAEADVRQIHRRRRDSWKRGVLIAAAPPAIIAGGFASAEGKAVAVAAGLIWGGMAAGLTAGLNALIHKHELVYEKVPAGTHERSPRR